MPASSCTVTQKADKSPALPQPLAAHVYSSPVSSIPEQVFPCHETNSQFAGKLFPTPSGLVACSVMGKRLGLFWLDAAWTGDDQRICWLREHVGQPCQDARPSALDLLDGPRPAQFLGPFPHRDEANSHVPRWGQATPIILDGESQQSSGLIQGEAEVTVAGVRVADDIGP